MAIRNDQIRPALTSAMDALPIHSYGERGLGNYRIFLEGLVPYPFGLAARKLKNGRMKLTLSADAYYGLYGTNLFEGIPTVELTAGQFMDPETLGEAILALIEQEKAMFIPRVAPVNTADLAYTDLVLDYIYLNGYTGTEKNQEYLRSFGLTV